MYHIFNLKSSIYYIMKDRTVRNADYRYGLINDGGQLLSEAELPLAPEALLRRVGRAVEAFHHRPGLNYPDDVGEQPQLHGLAGENRFVLPVPAFMDGAARVIENNSPWALLRDFERSRGKLPGHEAQHSEN